MIAITNDAGTVQHVYHAACLSQQVGVRVLVIGTHGTANHHASECHDVTDANGAEIVGGPLPVVVGGAVVEGDAPDNWGAMLAMDAKREAQRQIATMDEDDATTAEWEALCEIACVDIGKGRKAAKVKTAKAAAARTMGGML